MTDTTKICAIIGCSPMCFPWGWDEEDEYCVAMKLVMMNRVTLLRSQGVTRFHVSMDSGVGLYAAEIINRLRETDSEIELHCYVPYEEQATKWTPELRDRYFNALSTCTEVVTVAYEKTVGCKFKAHLEAMRGADTVIAVYDPDDSHCEREVAAGVVVKMLGKQFQIVDPKTIKLS
ncbi:MAG: DUF1273 family protein [Oscillospiraceae bacterium]|nr:DUF1273 family protein [Oscillospiraceae bacterium]